MITIKFNIYESDNYFCACYNNFIINALSYNIYLNKPYSYNYYIDVFLAIAINYSI